jgi:hypothetical protein
LVAIFSPFSVFLGCRKVFIELDTLSFVLSNMLIDPFMTDLEAVERPNFVRDLFWAPFNLQLLVNDLPFRLAYSLLGFVSSLQSFLMRLFQEVSSVAFITTQLPTDPRFVYANGFCNFNLAYSYFLKAINLESFFTGKLCLTHKCSFNSVRLEGSYSIVAYLSFTSLVALTS